ncbi:MAG: M6 family metalloprotease domain-containing protein [Candidatus Cloacimonadales bacterium]|jgi:M6 family metalloprotease-like protein|nr:M6 family metalloprotease domain-containing protein [Candidatus Cloacimonadales bacterium]
MIKRKLILLIGIVMLCQLLFAAWLTNEPMVVYQPDGTEIKCLASGDEFHNWLHNSEGYTIIQNQNTGDWVWATNQGDKLVATDYRVDKTSPVVLGIAPKANISNEEYKQKRDKFLVTAERFNSRAPHEGIINNLVVYIRFSDQSEFSQNISMYDQIFNQLGESANSMRHYFNEVSYNELDVVSTFYPAPDNNNIVVSYQDTYPRSYFLPYSTTNTNGYSNDNERTSREHKLLKRAVEAIASSVPTSLNLDGDNDGLVDNVCFIVRGSSGAWADLLWPHRWSLYTETVMINGKRVWDFNFQLENSLGSSGASVLSHEMFHSLGAPDLYRYEYNGEPIGAWDLMASNNNPPQHMGSYMKYRYSSWVSEIPLISQDGNYSLKTVKSSTNNCYRINSPHSDTEYFVLEYRNTNMGIFDSQLYGSGLLVYRVNDLYSGQGNASGPPDELYVYRPYGTPTYDGTISSAYFSLESGRTEINDATITNPFLSDGSMGGINIYNIGSALGDSITFSVQIAGANIDDIDEDFENGHFQDYDWQNESASPWTLVPGGYQSPNAAKSGSIGNSENSVLEITLNTNFGFIQFYKKTSCETSGDFLNFYVDGVLKDSWSGISDWQRIQYPIANGLHTFTWEYKKNQSGTMGEDAVFVDRIGFPEFAGPVYYPARHLTAQIDDRVVSLQWDAPVVSYFYDIGNVLSYKILANNEVLTTVAGNVLEYTYGPISGGSINYQIVAVYQDNDAEPSNQANVTAPFSEPLNLTGLMENTAVRLNWDAPEFANRGLEGYKVYRNGSSIFNGVIAENTYLDENVTFGLEYSYTVRAVYSNPTGLSPHSNSFDIIPSDTDSPELFTTKLYGNYPNPFNPSTSISFSLKEKSRVKISIYNVKGELVKELINSELPYGKHTIIWDGKNNHHKKAAAGIYMLKMEAPKYNLIKKMVMIK